TPEELDELFVYFGNDSNAAEIKKAIEQQLGEKKRSTIGLRSETDEIYDKIKRRINTPKRSYWIRTYRWWAAAVLLLCCVFAGYYLTDNSHSLAGDADQHMLNP